jgi:hypothetical protein
MFLFLNEIGGIPSLLKNIKNMKKLNMITHLKYFDITFLPFNIMNLQL